MVAESMLAEGWWIEIAKQQFERLHTLSLAMAKMWNRGLKWASNQLSSRPKVRLTYTFWARFKGLLSDINTANRKSFEKIMEAKLVSRNKHTHTPEPAPAHTHTQRPWRRIIFSMIYVFMWNLWVVRIIAKNVSSVIWIEILAETFVNCELAAQLILHLRRE